MSAGEIFGFKPEVWERAKREATRKRNRGALKRYPQPDPSAGVPSKPGVGLLGWSAARRV